MIDKDLTIKLYDSIRDANEPRVYKHWHASSIGECPRGHFYKRKGVPALREAGAGKMVRWQAGHILEEVIRPHLLKLYPDLKSNIRYTSEALDLTGEFDNYSIKEKALIEVKSVHVNAPNYIEKDGKPYLNHEYQNHAYVLLLEEKDLPVENIIYVYISLDGRILAVPTKVQSEILTNVKKRLDMLTKALETNIPPECFCQPDHPLWKSTTQYCDYKGDKECCSLDLYKSNKKERVTS